VLLLKNLQKPEILPVESMNMRLLLYKGVARGYKWALDIPKWILGLLPGHKGGAKRGAEHPPPSTAEVRERVELYLYSPTGSSWPVLGQYLPFSCYMENNVDTVRKI
jgi:hypothetical protein